MFNCAQGVRSFWQFTSTFAKRSIARASNASPFTGGLSENKLRLPHVSSVSIEVPNHKFEAFRICISPSAISVVNVPLPQHRKEIVDPLSHLRSRKEPPPLPCGTNDISLPQLQDIEKVDPNENVTEKRAARLIVIRRAKMKKHKWRKLQKKMKYVFAKKRQKRELMKEKAFQAVLLAKVKEAEKFEVNTFITRQLEVARWERPITRVRGFFAPDWVIKDHLREKEEEKRISDRIEECLRFKK